MCLPDDPWGCRRSRSSEDSRPDDAGQPPVSRGRFEPASDGPDQVDPRMELPSPGQEGGIRHEGRGELSGKRKNPPEVSQKQ